MCIADAALAVDDGARSASRTPAPGLGDEPVVTETGRANRPERCLRAPRDVVEVATAVPVPPRVPDAALAKRRPKRPPSVRGTVTRDAPRARGGEASRSVSRSVVPFAAVRVVCSSSAPSVAGSSCDWSEAGSLTISMGTSVEGRNADPPRATASSASASVGSTDCTFPACAAGSSASRRFGSGASLPGTKGAAFDIARFDAARVACSAARSPPRRLRASRVWVLSAARTRAVPTEGREGLVCTGDDNGRGSESSGAGASWGDRSATVVSSPGGRVVSGGTLGEGVCFSLSEAP